LFFLYTEPCPPPPPQKKHTPENISIENVFFQYYQIANTIYT
jgi:hypothetical protein